jgi:hypothetical protein
LKKGKKREEKSSRWWLRRGMKLRFKLMIWRGKEKKEREIKKKKRGVASLLERIKMID